jgi:hypothetical protein
LVSVQIWYFSADKPPAKEEEEAAQSPLPLFDEIIGY